MNLRFTGKRLTSGAAFLFCCSLLAQAPDDQLAIASQQAKQLMADGRFEEAIPLYKQLLQAVPGNPGLILNLGLAEEMAGHPAAAIPQFESVLKSQPNNVPALLSLGTAYLQLNKPKLAIAPLTKLISLDSQNRDAHGMLAGALMATDRWSEATQQYRKLTSLNPGDAKAWYGLGKAYEALSANSFNHLEKIAPESAYVLTLVAESQFSRQQYRSAFFFYQEASRKKPNLRTLHAGLAEVYNKTEHSDWAAVAEQQEKTLPPPNCALQKAECSFLSGNYLQAAQSAAANTPDALFWATKAYNALAFAAFDHLGNLPESAELHALKAELLRSHRQYLPSAEEYRSALKLAPDDPRLQQELITSLFLGKDYQTVIPLLKTELAVQPHSAETNFMLGDSFLRTEQPDGAIPFLQTALQAQPDMPTAHASLGLALMLTDHANEAIPHLEKSLAIDEDGSLHYQLARAYQAKGDTLRARELMTQYQRIQSRNQEHKDEVAREAQITAP